MPEDTDGQRQEPPRHGSYEARIVYLFFARFCWRAASGTETVPLAFFVRCAARDNGGTRESLGVYRRPYTWIRFFVSRAGDPAPADGAASPARRPRSGARARG